MTPDELVHKARSAWLNADGPSSHDDWCKAVAVVLEEAAKVADEFESDADPDAGAALAAAIRALVKEPTT